jgi:hypothetical protein
MNQFFEHEASARRWDLGSGIGVWRHGGGLDATWANECDLRANRAQPVGRAALS